MSSKNTRVVICTPSNVSFSLGGVTTPVNSIELCLSVNTIPYATVVIPPTSKTGDHKIDNLSLSQSANILKNLYRFADELKECSLSFTLDEVGGSSQQINLSGWLLTSVAPVTVSQMSGYTLACRIHHPAYRLLRYGYFGGSLKTPPSYNFVDPGVADLVDAADTVLTQIRTAEKVQPDFRTPSAPFASSYEEITKNIDQLLGEIPLPSTYLKFESDGTKLPLDNALGSITTGDGSAARNIAMCMSLTPSHNESIWDAFMSAASLWGCCVLPTFEQNKLTVSPITPWSKPTYTIPETSVYALSMPPYDANPVIGVKCAASSGGPLISGTSQPFESGLEGDKLSEWTYIPKGCVGQMANGRLIEIKTPPWMAVLQFAAQAMRACVISGDSKPGSNISVKDPMKGMTEGLYEAFCYYAAYMFQLMYKQKYCARVTCPLLISDSGGTITPGKSLSVQSETGSTVINGYISDVVHNISIDSGTAMTSIGISHCRPVGGYENIVPEGTKNPLYA